MARQGWGRHSTVATGSDSGDQVSVNAWNADIDKDGMLGFNGETIASASSITPTNSTIVLSGSTNVSTIAQGNSAEYDLLYVFTSGSVTLVNTSSPSSAGDIRLLANANKDLSTTVPTILIRKGTAWYEYGGGITNSLNDIGDVVITSVANEDVLAYDTTTSKWINQSADETGRVTADSTTTFTNKSIDLTTNTLTGTSLELKTAISDETGSGSLVFATSPTLVTPALGTPTSGTLTNCTFPTLNQSTTGNAATATALATARTIGGTSFDGTANIAVALAATSTALATARTIGGTSFDGTANIAVALAAEATTVTDNAITLAKMAPGTDGNLITYDTNGDPAAVATGTATHVLTSNGAGAAPTFQAPAGGGATIVHVFSNTTTTTYTGTASSFGTVGAGDRDIYIKKIDANNEGVFTKIWKNGAAVEVQIA